MKLQKYVTEDGEYPSTSEQLNFCASCQSHLLTSGTSKKPSQLGRIIQSGLYQDILSLFSHCQR